MVLFDTRLFRRIFQSKSASLYIDKIVNLLVKKRADEVAEDIDDDIRGTAGTWFERVGTYDGLSSIYLVPKTGSTIDYWVSEYPDFSFVKLWLYFDHNDFNLSGGFGNIRDMSYYDRHAAMSNNICVVSGGPGLTLPWRPDSVPSIVNVPNGTGQKYRVPDDPGLDSSGTDFSLVAVIYPKDFSSEKNYGQDKNIIVFDGNNDYIDCGNLSFLWSTTLTKFSMAIWVYPTAAWDGVDRWIVLHGSGNQRFQIHLPSGGPTGRATFRIVDSGGVSHDATNDGLIKNKWNHIVVTFDNALGSGNMKIYINNVVGTNATFTGSINQSAILTIGNTGANNTIFGNAKGFWWWNSALDSSNVTNLYNGREADVPRGDFILRMDEGTGNPKDSQNEGDGTLTNGAAWSFENTTSLAFDGVGDRLNLGNISSLWSAKQDKWSWAFYIHSTAFTDGSGFLNVCSHFTSGDNGMTCFFKDSDPGNLYVDIFNNGKYSAAKAPLVRLGVWTYVVLVYDGTLPSGNLKIYVDNVQGVSGISTTDDQLKGPYKFSADFVFSDSNFFGEMDNIKFWKDRALTVAEVNSLYTQTDDDDLRPDYWLETNEGTGNPKDSISLNLRGIPYEATFEGNAGWRGNIYAPLKYKAKVICTKSDDSASKYILYLSNAGDGRLKFIKRKSGVGDTSQVASTLLSLNTWYWIVVTWTDATNTIKIYINGTDVTSAFVGDKIECNKSTDIQDVFICSKNHDEGFFGCGIYLFGYIRRAVSSTEVSNFFTNKATFSNLTAAQVAWIDYAIPQ